MARVKVDNGSFIQDIRGQISASGKSMARVAVESGLTPEQLSALYDDPEVPWYVHPRNRERMQPGLSLAYLQDGRVTGFWLGCMSTPGNYAVQGVWRSAAAPLSTFHILVTAHLSLCYYHGGGDFLYHCSPAVEFADELIQRYSEGNYRRLEDHRATIPLEPDNKPNAKT